MTICYFPKTNDATWVLRWLDSLTSCFSSDSSRIVFSVSVLRHFMILFWTNFSLFVQSKTPNDNSPVGWIQYYCRSSRARHGAPQGTSLPNLTNLTDQISTNQHPQNRVLTRAVAPISPRQRSVPRSFSAEINTSIPSASTLSMPEP